MHPTIYRQGDILFTLKDANPFVGTVSGPKDSLEIAQGELTGHHHVARGPNLIPLFVDGQDIVDFLAPEGCKIEHEEHAPLLLPPGSYRVTRQREYTYSNPVDVAD